MRWRAKKTLEFATNKAGPSPTKIRKATAQRGSNNVHSRARTRTKIRQKPRKSGRLAGVYQGITPLITGTRDPGPHPLPSPQSVPRAAAFLSHATRSSARAVDPEKPRSGREPPNVNGTNNNKWKPPISSRAACYSPIAPNRAPRDL